MRSRFVGMLCLGLALCLFGAGVAPSLGQTKNKDGLIEKKLNPKDEKGKVGEKKAGEKTGAKGIAGKVASVTPKTGHFTISPAEGKDRTFQVTEKTKFVGPRGGNRGVGMDGLKDDCMKVGFQVRVVPAADGKDAAVVHLPTRK